MIKSLYRYYLLMRPFVPGAIPKCKVVNSESFPERRFIPAINHNAYVWFDTEEPLNVQDVIDYELAEVKLI